MLQEHIKIKSEKRCSNIANNIRILNEYSNIRIFCCSPHLRSFESCTATASATCENRSSDALNATITLDDDMTINLHNNYHEVSLCYDSFAASDADPVFRSLVVSLVMPRLVMSDVVEKTSTRRRSGIPCVVVEKK